MIISMDIDYITSSNLVFFTDWNFFILILAIF